MNCVNFASFIAWVPLQSLRNVKARGEDFCTAGVRRDYHGLILSNPTAKVRIISDVTKGN